MRISIGLITLVFGLTAVPILGFEPKKSATSPLIQRNQIRLTLTGAETVIAGAQQKAKELKLRVNITVVDEGGHPIAFARMDGARPASIYTSITKATTAATIKGPTGPLPPGKSTDTHLSLAVENAAKASGGKFTTLKGGIPIIVEDQVIGAVGVGGGTGEQDAIIAEAGADALVQALANTDSAIILP